jgi:uracil-DNA glycosylase
MRARFSDIVEKMKVCSLCEGLELGPKPIFKLSSNVKILIAGQAPGRITHLKGRPFDDPSGERLRAWLGIDKTAFYDDDRIGIFPMGLCFPGSGKGGDIAPRPLCAQTWRKPIMEHLTQLELIVILGRYAVDWHVPALGKVSVAKAVRSAAEDTQTTMILPHPSPRNNRWLKQNPWFEQDVIPQLQARVARSLT